LLGLALGFAAALDLLHARVPGFAMALGASAVIALALRTVQYEGEWQSELRLWGHAVTAQPDAYYAFMKLGEVRRDRGELDGAIRAYQHALQLEPLRKLGHAALFQAVALRDERGRKLVPSRAELYAHEYYQRLSDAEGLRALGARLLEAGYARAPELPAERALNLQQPFPDEVLEHAAAAQFAQGRPGLALLYLRHMRQPSRRPDLLRLSEQARDQMRNSPVL
jgi:tetratricopeptide (TPR) repeat protein